MKIKQHVRGACVDQDTGPKEAEFNSYFELVSIPWVKKFMDHPYPFSPLLKNPFKTFSISTYSDECDLLIAEFNLIQGWKESHWVVGYLSKDCMDKLALPIWEHPKNEG